jgi:hypothetical protein
VPVRQDEKVIQYEKKQAKDTLDRIEPLFTTDRNKFITEFMSRQPDTSTNKEQATALYKYMVDKELYKQDPNYFADIAKMA